jgi:hypothetical protein
MPSGTPYACDDAQFATDQSEFAAGTLAADQPVDICGSVTEVLAEKKSRSGEHGYFYVEMPSGYRIRNRLESRCDGPSLDRPAALDLAVGLYRKLCLRAGPLLLR